jgi:hypothetical protein
MLTNLFSNPLFTPILIVVAILVVVVVVVIPLFFKLRQKHLKTKETNSIMKDLMTWRHLSDLVKGGRAHTKAKSDLSDNLVKIDALLKEGFAAAQTAGRNLYSVPWFMLLGEPRSGKSALLSESSLELVPSEKEDTAAGSESLPVRLWNGAKAVICDVSGRVFFDRWLDGSSAEWSFILRAIARRHRKRPLDGVILTIPADALIADSDNATHKKAIICANELGALLDTCGMKLPVYVVVTKLDLVDGFREYTAGMVGDFQHQIVGFDSDGTGYDEEAIGKSWADLLEKIGQGFSKLLTSREVAASINAPANRLEYTGKMFGLASNLADIAGNLDIYLSALFGENSYQGHRNALFKGVYFTSAQDTGVSLNRRMAALVGKNADDAAIPANGAVHSRPFFVRDLFNRWIFTPSGTNGAEFTARQRILHRLPYYLPCAALAACALVWVYTAAFKTDEWKGGLRQATGYYRWLSAELSRNDPFYSPLVGQYSDGTARLILDRPLLTGSTFSRGEFFEDNVAYRDARFEPPFGFWAASAIATLGHTNLAYTDRALIVNQLYGEMVSAPVIEAAGRAFQRDAVARTPVTKATREVIRSFFLLGDFTGKLPRTYRTSAITDYALPDLTIDDRALLNQYRAAYARNSSFYVDTSYFHTKDFTDAQNAALTMLRDSWRSQSAYPDSLFGRLVTLRDTLEDLIANDRALSAELANVGNLVTYNEVALGVYQWEDLVAEQKRLLGEGRRVFNAVRADLKAHHVPLDLAARVSRDPFSDDVILRSLYSKRIVEYAKKEYTALFTADMKFLDLHSSEYGNDYSKDAADLRETFTGALDRRFAALLEHVDYLRTNSLLTKKLDERKPASPTVFLVREEAINLLDAVDIPSANPADRAPLQASWQQGQNAVNAALVSYDEWAQKYADAKALGTLTADARTMLMAKIYVNRYTTFTGEINFLSTSPANIAAVVAQLSPDRDYLEIAGAAIGGVQFDQRYDPRVVQNIIREIAAFAQLFQPNKNADAPVPRFLVDVDTYLYEPEPWRIYVDEYLNYWGTFADNCYTPVYTWGEFQRRVYSLKTATVNATLQALYKKAFDVVSGVDDSILAGSLKNEKTRNLGLLNDKLTLISQFTAAKADQMLVLWGNLPPSAQRAYTTLQAIGDDERNATYLGLYSGNKATTIGWWSDFSANGMTIVTRVEEQTLVNQFMGRIAALRSFPLVADAPPNNALSSASVSELASLLGALGVSSTTAAANSLTPNMFTGFAAQSWAATVNRFVSVAGNPQKPLTWKLTQPPVQSVEALDHQGRLDAFVRFRYVQVAVADKSPLLMSSAGSRALTLLEGNADDRALTVRFFLSSTDSVPAVSYTFPNPWAIFNLYLAEGTVADSAGNTYIPLYLEDPTGNYVYYVQVDFSAPLPDRSEWYTLSTWPSFVATGGGIGAR